MGLLDIPLDGVPIELAEYITRLDNERQGLVDVLAVALAELRRLEHQYCQASGEHRCPRRDEYRAYGHEPNCSLAAAIAKAEGREVRDA